MSTTVGTENSTAEMIRNLLILEHDAIAAYDSAIERLDTPEFRTQIESFRSDHEEHVAELTRLAPQYDVTPPQEGDMKQLLTTGKVALAGMAGDSSILKAMKTNEDDTVMAYEQALKNTVADAQLRPVLEKGASDERRHRSWMESNS